MKKLLRALVFAVMAVCFSLPCFGSVEAASVALLPLVNNVNDDLANQVYYKEAMAVINSKPGFVLVENDELTKAVEDAKVAGRLPSEAELRKIAQAGGVDIVISMELNKLDQRVRHSTKERKLILELQAGTVAYNALTGAFYSRSIRPSVSTPEATTARWDWLHEQWGRQVRLEVGRALNGK